MTGARDPLRKLDASMIHGLPDPNSPMATDWLERTLQALREQHIEMAEPTDLGPVEARLTALEARPLPGPPVDLSTVWEAIAFLRKRMGEMEGRILQLESATPEVAPVIVRSPLDPLSWDDLPSAQAALTVLITEEAAKRAGHSVEMYEEMVELDARQAAGLTTFDEDVKLLQHQEWAKERQMVELSRLTHNRLIRVLPDLAAARSYDWRQGWPDLE